MDRIEDTVLEHLQFVMFYTSPEKFWSYCVSYCKPYYRYATNIIRYHDIQSVYIAQDNDYNDKPLLQVPNEWKITP